MREQLEDPTWALGGIDDPGDSTPQDKVAPTLRIPPTSKRLLAASLPQR